MAPQTLSAKTSDAEQDYVLSEQDFGRVIKRIYELAGIVIEPQKRQMIHARLSRRLRATGIDTFKEYLDKVEAGRDPEELQQFINAITTNLTSFFRENHHFVHFEKHVLAPKAGTGDSKLRIWSGGCSTGEEPYSIALTILKSVNPVPSNYKILATDLDTKVLEKCKAGIYPIEKAGAIISDHSRFVSKSADGQFAEIGSAAKSLISFRQLNLMENWPMSGPFDAVFCRNVLIYFDPETKARLVNRFAEMVRPGGYLYLGHSESILGEHPLFENEGQTTYRRRT